jgi:hypothetical protein
VACACDLDDVDNREAGGAAQVEVPEQRLFVLMSDGKVNATKQREMRNIIVRALSDAEKLDCK